jgi:hypothetical protein
MSAHGLQGSAITGRTSSATISVLDEVVDPPTDVQLPSGRRRAHPAARPDRATSSNALLNAFWNAFSKFFASSKAPVRCRTATKRA